MTMQDVFKLIAEERARQDAKWGSQRSHTDEHWLTILHEETGEVAKAILDREPESALEKEIVQVAAVAVCWLESRCAATSASPRPYQDPAAPGQAEAATAGVAGAEPGLRS